MDRYRPRLGWEQSLVVRGQFVSKDETNIDLCFWMNIMTSFQKLVNRIFRWYDLDISLISQTCHEYF